jgi:hypothetical protein
VSRLGSYAASGISSYASYVAAKLSYIQLRWSYVQRRTRVGWAYLAIEHRNTLVIHLNMHINLMFEEKRSIYGITTAISHKESTP